MTAREDIFKRVKQVLVDTFEVDGEAIQPGAHLYEDLDLDSLDAIDLAVKLKSETGIKLTEQEMKAIRTVDDVVAVVADKLGNRGAVGKPAE